jgi:hypothetical protein
MLNLVEEERRRVREREWRACSIYHARNTNEFAKEEDRHLIFRPKHIQTKSTSMPYRFQCLESVCVRVISVVFHARNKFTLRSRGCK